LDSKEESDPDTKSSLVVIGARVDSDIVRPENLLARSSADPAGRVLIVLQTHDPKMKIDPVGKIMSLKSVEFLIVIAPKAPT
jgi:hypothetical protein